MGKVYIDRVLEVAKAEVGYLEKKSNAQLDDKLANAGDKNYTKYARDLAQHGYYNNGNKQGFAWCDMFVDWCFLQAASGDSAHAQEVQCQTGPYGAGCTFSSRYYDYQGRFYKSGPMVGDQIFFGTDKNNVTHTGIVYKVDDKRVYTIEGNTSSGEDVVIPNGGAVAYKSYALTNARIWGYGRPKYDGDVTPAPEPEPIHEPETAPTPAPEPVPAAKRYNTVAEAPRYAQETLRKLIRLGALKGRTGETDEDALPVDLDLSDDMLRNLVIADRAGAFGE